MWQKLTSIAKSHALAGYQTWEVGCNALDHFPIRASPGKKGTNLSIIISMNMHIDL